MRTIGVSAYLYGSIVAIVHVSPPRKQVPGAPSGRKSAGSPGAASQSTSSLDSIRGTQQVGDRQHGIRKGLRGDRIASPETPDVTVGVGGGPAINAARNWLGTVESTASVFFRRASQQTLLRLLTARIASAMAADYLYLRDLVSSSLRSSGSSSHRANG